MSDLTAQVEVPKSDVTAVTTVDNQTGNPQQEAGQPDASAGATDQSETTQLQPEASESENQTAVPTATGVDGVKTPSALVNGDATVPSSSTDQKNTLGLTADSNPVDPIFGEAESVKIENDNTAEMGQSSSTLAAGLAQENERQNGNGRSERSRSESTGGASVKSGGSSASALPENVPRVGGVRCYWAFLKPRYPDPSDPKSKFELEFIHLDPVLSAHMRSQSLSMLGRGVIEFIHPEEREQARRDLFSSIQVDNLEGSVTRVRFARLSRIRTILGCPPEEDDIPDDAHKFVEDGEYLALDLSIHWACTGLILAFFHAIKDKDANQNNDISKRHEEWSNYCGTASISEEDIESMWKDVSENIPCPPANGPAPPPERVFIVHTTEESAVRPNSVIFAWPPPRIKFGDDQGGNKEPPTNGETTNALAVFSPKLDENGREVPRMDGSYWADDYAELMKHVELENKTGKEDAWGTFGKTSCTSRFQGGHLMTNEGLWRKIESIFIPYGNITFASYQTTQALPLNTANDLNVPTALLPTDVQAGADPQPYYDVFDGSNPVWPQPTAGQVGHPMTLDGQVQAYPAEWEQETHTAPGNLAPLTGTSMQFYAQNGYSQDYSHGAAPSFPMHSLAQAADMQYHVGHGVPWVDPTATQPSQQRGTKRKPSEGPGGDKYIVPYHSSGERIVSGSPHGLSAGDLAVGTTSVPAGRGRKITTVKKGEDGQTIVKVTVAVPPPEGVEACVQCGTRESPEWRKSESGIKNLCNACGLKLARLQAKREGRQKPRKKKPSTNAPGASGSPANGSGPLSAGSSIMSQQQGQPMHGMMSSAGSQFGGDPNMTLNSLNSWPQ